MSQMDMYFYTSVSVFPRDVTVGRGNVLKLAIT